MNIDMAKAIVTHWPRATATEVSANSPPMIHYGRGYSTTFMDDTYSSPRPATLSSVTLKATLAHFRSLLNSPVEVMNIEPRSDLVAPMVSRMMSHYNTLPSSFVPIVKTEPKVWKQKEFDFE